MLSDMLLNRCDWNNTSPAATKESFMHPFKGTEHPHTAVNRNSSVSLRDYPSQSVNYLHSYLNSNGLGINSYSCAKIRHNIPFDNMSGNPRMQLSKNMPGSRIVPPNVTATSQGSFTSAASRLPCFDMHNPPATLSRPVSKYRNTVIWRNAPTRQEFSTTQIYPSYAPTKNMINQAVPNLRPPNQSDKALDLSLKAGRKSTSVDTTAIATAVATTANTAMNFSSAGGTNISNEDKSRLVASSYTHYQPMSIDNKYNNHSTELDKATTTPEKKFFCNHCIFQAYSESCMLIHLISNHIDVVLPKPTLSSSSFPPFACPYCPFVSEQEQMAWHMLDHYRWCEPCLKCAVCTKNKKNSSDRSTATQNTAKPSETRNDKQSSGASNTTSICDKQSSLLSVDGQNACGRDKIDKTISQKAQPKKTDTKSTSSMQKKLHDIEKQESVAQVDLEGSMPPEINKGSTGVDESCNHEEQSRQTQSLEIAEDVSCLPVSIDLFRIKLKSKESHTNTSEVKMMGINSPEIITSEVKTPEIKFEVKTPEVKSPEQRAPKLNTSKGTKDHVDDSKLGFTTSSEDVDLNNGSKIQTDLTESKEEIHNKSTTSGNNKQAGKADDDSQDRGKILAYMLRSKLSTVSLKSKLGGSVSEIKSLISSEQTELITPKQERDLVDHHHDNSNTDKLPVSETKADSITVEDTVRSLKLESSTELNNPHKDCSLNNENSNEQSKEKMNQNVKRSISNDCKVRLLRVADGEYIVKANEEGSQPVDELTAKLGDESDGVGSLCSMPASPASCLTLASVDSGIDDLCDDTIVICPFCPKQLICRLLPAHVQFHNSNCQYKCSKCTFSSSFKWALDTHIQCHKEEPSEDARKLTIEQWNTLQQRYTGDDEGVEVAQRLLSKPSAPKRRAVARKLNLSKRRRSSIHSPKSHRTRHSSPYVDLSDFKVNKSLAVDTGDFLSKLIAKRQKSS